MCRNRVPGGIGWDKIREEKACEKKMRNRNVEQLEGYYHRSENPSAYEISRMMDVRKQQIRQEWQRYKMARKILHGVEVKDEWPDMLMLYDIKRGKRDG